MSRPDVKSQHYVPRVYLQRFANTKDQVWVYDKEERRSFPSNIKNVAAESRFYDSKLLQEVTGDKQFIERHLCGIEAKYASVAESILSSLSSRKFKTLRAPHRHFLAAYLVIQMMRTREARIEHQQMVEVFQKIHDQLLSAMESSPDAAQGLGDRTSSEIAQEMQHRALLDGPRIAMMARVLYRHIWVIFEAPQAAHFFTSDHPFVKRPHIVDPLRGTDGIACEGIEIMFPISPRYLLALFERSYFSDVSAGDGSSVKISDSEGVLYFNQFQVHQSSRFVFARHDDFSQVEEILESMPIYGESNRKRVATNQDDLIGRDGDHHSA